MRMQSWYIPIPAAYLHRVSQPAGEAGGGGRDGRRGRRAHHQRVAGLPREDNDVGVGDDWLGGDAHRVAPPRPEPRHLDVGRRSSVLQEGAGEMCELLSAPVQAEGQGWAVPALPSTGCRGTDTAARGRVIRAAPACSTWPPARQRTSPRCCRPPPAACPARRSAGTPPPGCQTPAPSPRPGSTAATCCGCPPPRAPAASPGRAPQRAVGVGAAPPPPAPPHSPALGPGAGAQGWARSGGPCPARIWAWGSIGQEGRPRWVPDHRWRCPSRPKISAARGEVPGEAGPGAGRGWPACSVWVRRSGPQTPVAL